MPWQLPPKDVDKAWSLIYKNTLRWELRYAGGIKLAVDEVRPEYLEQCCRDLETTIPIDIPPGEERPPHVCMCDEM